MRGAYTAKPAAPYVPPDVPPGWRITWPFPGPWPPNYISEYSLEVDVAESITVGSGLAVRAELVDTSAFAVTQPDSVIVWYASLDGEPVGIGTEDGVYAGYAYIPYGEITGTTYGFQSFGNKQSLYFDLEPEDDGKIITLWAESTVAGQPMLEFSLITVSATAVVFRATWEAGQLHQGKMASYGAVVSTTWGFSGDLSHRNQNDDPPNDVITENVTNVDFTITMPNPHPQGVYDLDLRFEGYSDDHMLYYARLEAFGEVYEVSGTADGDTGDVDLNPWVTVDSINETVTIVNTP